MKVEGHGNEPVLYGRDYFKGVTLPANDIELYLPDERAPWHGISHPERVLDNAAVLVDRAGFSEEKINFRALRKAIELHDAYSHLRAADFGAQSAEHLAAAAAYQDCLNRGESEAFAQQVAGIIMASNWQVVPKTIEQILMRCADLENLGGPYDGFARGTQALHIEAVNLKKTNAPLKEWMRGAYDYLGGFIYPVLRLTPNAFDEAGRSRWHQQAIGNLARQWREVVSKDAPIVVEFFTGSKIEPCAQLAPDAFYIAVHPNQERRREALGTLRSFVKPVNGVAFAIPGNCGAASLPDGLCTQIVLPDGYELNELERARILRS